MSHGREAGDVKGDHRPGFPVFETSTLQWKEVRIRWSPTVSVY